MAFVLGVLALSVTASGASYLKRAHACRYMSLPQAVRAPCCSLGGTTRFTPPGGDCCKHLNLDASVPAGTTDSGVEVPMPMVAVVTFAPMVQPARLLREAPAVRARAPPPRWRPTDFTVLRI